MSALQTYVKRWRLALVLPVLVLAVGVYDAQHRPPERVGVRLFVASVELYRLTVRPLTSRWIRCRYRPTCSEYAIEAVEKYGLLGGLARANRRVWSCRRSVPMGTFDPP
jgi:putative membrane protein insertion efficiency factor